MLDPSIDATAFPSLTTSFEAITVEGYRDPNEATHYLVLMYFEVAETSDSKDVVDHYWKGLGKHAIKTTSRMVTDRYMLDGDALESNGLRHHHKFMARAVGANRVAIATLGCFSKAKLVPACEDTFASFALPAEAAALPPPAIAESPFRGLDSDYTGPPPPEPEERRGFVANPFILVAGIAVIALLAMSLLLFRKRKISL